MKRLWIVVLFLPTLLSAATRTYHVNGGVGSDVSGTGTVKSPYKTVTYALKKVVAGDTVCLHGGTYVEASIKPAASGRNGASIVVRCAEGEERATLQCSDTGNDSRHAIFDFSGMSYIKLDGLRFANSPYLRTAVSITGKSHHITVENCAFDSLGNKANTSWDANSMIWVYNATDCSFVNNSFDHICGDGISLNSKTTRCLVAGNSFSYFSGKDRSWSVSVSRTIDIQDSSDGQHLVAFNRTETAKNAIWLDRDGSHNYIVRNEAYNCGTAVFNESRCEGNTVEENLAYKVVDNPAYMTAHYMTGWTYNARWINNVAYACKQGFLIDKSVNNELRGNIAYACTGSNVEVTDSAYRTTAPTFCYNLWFSPTLVNSCRYRGTALSPSRFAKSVGDEHQLQANPQFVSMTANGSDFSLKTSSPCRGTGYRGTDMGCYPVYPRLPAGRDTLRARGNAVEVAFDALCDTLERGASSTLMLRLNKASATAVTARIKAVAGDARLGDDVVVADHVVFEPGSTQVALNIDTRGIADRDQMVVLRIDSVQGAQPASRDICLLRLLANDNGQNGVDDAVATGKVQRMEAYTLNGILVARSGNVDMDGFVRTLPRGFYLLKSIRTDGVEIRKIFVK
jgi:hypothetical protein